MKKLNACWKLISAILLIATLVTALPLSIIADEIIPETQKQSELYVKSIKGAQAKTREEAKKRLEKEGYIFLEGNLNEGTGEEGVWLGYTTTTDPNEAIYDLKVMNTKGGYTLTSVEDALKKQETALATMATDLELLIEEFVLAYEEGSVAAQKAYMTLNFFRMVEKESVLAEENGLGYYIVNGNMSASKLTEMIMLCDSDLVDSVVKILTTGIQTRNENWMEALSKVGPYDSNASYGDDEAEVKRRAEQLLIVLQFYAEAYNAMNTAGLIPDSLDENFEPIYSDKKNGDPVPAEDAEIKKLDEARYKMYKIVFDELAKYKYGTSGDTLKDFFCSLESEGNAKKLYPLVSVLSDGEFSALSYGCFLEVAVGATATTADFDRYDEVYQELTKEVQSVYLYQGVDKALLNNDSIIGFTEAASRHMATTGELEFFEKETRGENSWETGKNVAKAVGAAGMALIGVSKITFGTTMLISLVSTTVASSVKSGMLAGLMKFCSLVSGMYATLIVAAVALVIALISYIVMLVKDSNDNEIDWVNNPIPEYLYDVKEVAFSQSSTNDGIATESLRKTVFSFYQVVLNVDEKPLDLNAYSDDASQWIALYVSHDRQGDNAKPIKATELLVKTGNGETPEGYQPLTSFSTVVAYNLNQWDDDDDVNGVYLFYKQDTEIAVESNVTYYIYDVYLQVGESDAHCIDLLQAAGYTPLNVNLSPSLDNGGWFNNKYVYTYLGYKLTTNPTSAIRDLRLVYGPSQGEMKLGSATYAECGSNGTVTLYATKYKSAGTPILGGGLQVVTERKDAGVGYEPVNLFSGGPAVSFNVLSDGLLYDTPTTYLYFLPETTFTQGIAYLSGVTYMKYQYEALLEPLNSLGGNYEEELLKYMQETIGWEYTGAYQEQWIQNGGRYIPIHDHESQISTVKTLIDYKLGYDYEVVLQDKSVPRADVERDDMWDSVWYAQTYNPYRAIYDLKGTTVANNQPRLSMESIGYLSSTQAVWVFHNNVADDIANIGANFNKTYLTINQQGGAEEIDLGSRLYVTGNPSGSNEYDKTQNAMSEREPIRISDFHCISKNSGVKIDTKAFTAVSEVFTDSKDAIVFENAESKVSFTFYFSNNAKERPYVTAVSAIDEMSLVRAYEGQIKLHEVRDSMLLAQLANQGATNFCGISVGSYPIDTDKHLQLNNLKFGYTRSETASAALRDMFLYFNGFSNDDPPNEIYRGSVKYTLLCEIPYDLSFYEDAPKVGIYLYGTTDSRAGNRIVDFTVSSTPFMDGYQTVRTKDGNSLFKEIRDYADAQEDSHIFKYARELFSRIKEFFVPTNEVLKTAAAPFYLHIKREGTTQKPYVEKIYVLATKNTNGQQTYEELFSMGAENYIPMEFNEGTWHSTYIYIGFSYTADPSKAITDIRAYHKKNPPAMLLEDGGFEYYLASNVDLNQGAGGDYIYLYTTTEERMGSPIIDLDAGYKVQISDSRERWINGGYADMCVGTVQMWKSTDFSDLNDGAWGKYIYLTYKHVHDSTYGSYRELNYGADKTYTRKDISGLKENGKYIGALYVMDKNTLRQEKLAAGVASENCTCDKISDQEVFDRLKQMGATTIIEKPLQLTGGEYKGNTNKVFIGYSRTDNIKTAIKSIAVKVELLSLDQPAESMEIDRKSYKLVAEAARKVTELPHAVNLIGVQDGEDLQMPRMYLYYSTVGSTDPIYDICIDDNPMISNWTTVVSDNKLEPFTDVHLQAKEQYNLAKQDTKDHPNTPFIYTNQFKNWMEDLYELFDPGRTEIQPFYLHVKKVETDTVKESKPYVSEIVIAKGDTKNEALSALAAYEPDDYVDISLNRDAGGDWIFMGVKRVTKVKDALTDLVVFKGKNPDAIKRLDIGTATSIKYSLVSDIDLNSDAGGSYLYLYSADSSSVGNPITDVCLENDHDSYLKCGAEQVPVTYGSGKTMTTDVAEMNAGAYGTSPSAYLYMIMYRETTEGHTLSDQVETLHQDPTCGKEGHDTVIFTCVECNARLEKVTMIPVTGSHFDADNDGDHSCDVCGKKNLTTHIRGEGKEEDRKEATDETDGSYKLVYYCTECNTKLQETKIIIPAGTPARTEKPLGASVLSGGSLIAICSMAAVAGIAAIFIRFVKKRK